ncbi:MAG: PAS domain-containing protein [Melioribacteraceae bacterium]|nr:PAS domain-containing protein [Melioribacteraceae bacterium]
MLLINFNIISLFSFFSNSKSFSLIISNVLENNALLIIGLLLILLLVIIAAYSVTISKLKRSRTALHESKERANKLANLTFEGIVIHDSGILIDSNESFLKMFGYISEELKNKDVVKLLIHPDDLKIVKEKVRGKITKPYEVRGVKKNGEIIPLEIESREIELDGKPVRVAALRDITERKKQEELIKKEQWLLSTMMKNIPDSIYFKDLESKFIRVNKSTVEKFNLQSADQIIGKSDFDIFDEEHARPAYEDEQRIIKTGKPIINKIEKESWKDGKIGWASTSKMPLYDSAGNIIGTFGLTRDITDLKNAQDNLKAEKEKFEQLLSLVPSAVFTVDLEQRITSWNMMAERLTGYKADEIIGQKCTLTNQSPCKDSCGLFSKDVEKPIVDAECHVKRKDGTLITVSKNVDLLRDETGKVIGGIESFIDISERKRFEEQIKKMNEALEETNKSKDRFSQSSLTI